MLIHVFFQIELLYFQLTSSSFQCIHVCGTSLGLMKFATSSKIYVVCWCDKFFTFCPPYNFANKWMIFCSNTNQTVNNRHVPNVLFDILLHRNLYHYVIFTNLKSLPADLHNGSDASGARCARSGT